VSGGHNNAEENYVRTAIVARNHDI